MLDCVALVKIHSSGLEFSSKLSTNPDTYYIPTDPHHVNRSTRIRPGAFYIFFRKLSQAAPTTSLRGGIHKSWYETLQVEGTYRVRVKNQHPSFAFPGVFKLTISESGEDATSHIAGCISGVVRGTADRRSPAPIC
jgi:hypothetical protein